LSKMTCIVCTRYAVCFATKINPLASWPERRPNVKAQPYRETASAAARCWAAQAYAYGLTLRLRCHRWRQCHQQKPKAHCQFENKDRPAVIAYGDNLGDAGRSAYRMCRARRGDGLCEPRLEFRGNSFTDPGSQRRNIRQLCRQRMADARRHARVDRKRAREANQWRFLQYIQNLANSDQRLRLY